MISLSLFNNDSQIHNEEHFMNNVLHISTHLDGNNLDKFFELCLDELEPYAIPTESDLELSCQYYLENSSKYSDFTDDYLKALYATSTIPNPIGDTICQNKHRFNQLLKENCILAAFYTAKFLSSQTQNILYYHALENEIISEESRRRANTALKNSMPPSYLNDFILSVYDEYPPRIYTFCKDLSLQLILNHQRKQYRKDDKDSHPLGDFTIFDLEGTLKSFCPSKEWNSKQLHLQKNRIFKLIEGITDVALSWEPNSEDQFEQVLYLYRKEFIFHCQAILNYLKNTTKGLFTYTLFNEQTRFGFYINPLLLGNNDTEDLIDWIHLFKITTMIPITHKLSEMIELNPYLIKENATANCIARLPILYKTYFINIYNYFGSLEKMLKELSNYIHVSGLTESYIKHDIPEVNEEKIFTLLNDLSSSEMSLLNIFEQTLISIFHFAGDPFHLYIEDCLSNQLLINSKDKKDAANIYIALSETKFWNNLS